MHLSPLQKLSIALVLFCSVMLTPSCTRWGEERLADERSELLEVGEHLDRFLRKLPMLQHVLRMNGKTGFEPYDAGLPRDLFSDDIESTNYRRRLHRKNQSLLHFVLGKYALMYGAYHPYEMEEWVRTTYFQDPGGADRKEEVDLLGAKIKEELNDYGCGIFAIAAAGLIVLRGAGIPVSPNDVIEVLKNYPGVTRLDDIFTPRAISKLRGVADGFGMNGEEKLKEFMGTKKAGQSPARIKKYLEGNLGSLSAGNAFRKNLLAEVVADDDFNKMVEELVTALSEGKMVVPLLYLENSMHYFTVCYAIKHKEWDTVEYFVIRETDGMFDLVSRAELRRLMCSDALALQKVSDKRDRQLISVLRDMLSPMDFQETMGQYAEGIFTSLTLGPRVGA